MNRITTFAAGAILMATATASAGTWLRANHLGSPWQTQRVTVLSDSDRTGASWTLTGPDGAVADRGTLPTTTVGITGQNPKAYGTVLDLNLPSQGTWKLAVSGSDTAKLVRSNSPWTFLAPLLVRHLRLMRSGPDQSLFRAPSHLGDTACQVMIPDGSWSNGAWKNGSPTRKVNAVGGWYDAGDQIKFTLTTAYTTYYLLRAWQANPGIHGRTLSTSSLPDLLDEARHGLDYLDRMLVDDTTFVIEVGDGKDHEQGSRLPQFDALDGQRPALVASSPMQMGFTGAALALGSRVFASLDPERAARWKATALRLHAISTAPGASREGAFFRQTVNDFYSDPTPYDNLALMERELHALTGDSLHLKLARSFADSAGVGGEPGWTDVATTVNADMAADWPASRQRLTTGFQTYKNFAKNSAPLWGIASQPGWCQILGWPVLAAETWRSSAVVSDTSLQAFSRDLMDYLLGRNNWGVSFVMSRRIPGSVKNIFNPIYTLSGEFPEGAVAEGPGSKSVHQSLAQYFSIPATSPETPFNTTTTVFYDNATDFQTMETTIAQQATMLYLLSVLTKSTGDTTVPSLPPVLQDSAETWLASLQKTRVPFIASNWSVYDDKASGGISSVTLASKSDTGAEALFSIGKGDALQYPYAGLSQTLSATAKALPWGSAVGVRLVYDLSSGRTTRLQVKTSDVTDYDYFGATLPGKGNATEKVILFRDLAQQGFGKAIPTFAPAKVTGLDWVFSAIVDSLPFAVRSVELLFDAPAGIRTASRMPAQALRLSGRNLTWAVDRLEGATLELVGADGSRTLLGTPRVSGSMRLPATAGVRWAILRSNGATLVCPVPPGR